MRRLGGVLFCLALLLGIVQPASAQPNPTGPRVQMLVRAGFEGSGKVGSWLPVWIDLRNDGDEVDGEVQIVIQDTSTNRGNFATAPTTYSAPIVLPRRARKQLQMEVRVPNTTQRLRARLVQADQLILEQDVQFTRVSSGDLLCGVLSRTSASLEFIPTLELAPPLRRARIARLEVPDVPTRPQLLSSLDCLIVDNIPTSGMSEAQRDAVRTWVANGGLLIVAGGSQWQRTFQGLPTDLLPVRVTSTTPLDDLTNLAGFVSQPVPASGQFLASQAVVMDGNPVIEQNGTPLLVSARRGVGTVFYLGLDPAAEPLRSWPGQGDLWRYMLSHVAMSGTITPAASTPFVGWGRVPRNALIDVSPLSSPSPLPIVATLVAFGLAIGPGNYLLLRRFGQPAWAVITVPLLSGIAALATFGIANANRESDAILNQVTIVRASPRTPVSLSRTYIGLMSRREATYTVRAPLGSLVYAQFFPFPRNPASERPNWGLQVVSGPSPQVSDLRLSAGSLGTFTVEGSYRINGTIDTDLAADGNTIQGTISNRSRQTLSDALLVVDYHVTRIGDLRPDESREISITLPTAASAGYGPPNSFASHLYPAGLPGKKPSDAARRDILDSAFGQTFNFSRLDFHGPTLLGWLEDGGLELDVQPSRPNVVQNTLLLQAIEVRLPRGFEGEVPAALVTHRTLGATTASRQQFGSYDLAPGESVALQYTLPIHGGRFHVDRLQLNVEGRLRGPGSVAARLGAVQLYNWRTAEWEEQPLLLGTNALPNAPAYLSGTGDVRLRYTFKPDPDAQVAGISFSRLDVSAAGLLP